MNATRPYWSPYVAGVALGVTLLATYLLMGFGLGASGAFAQVGARLEGVVAPARAQADPYVVGYLEAGRLWAQWIVVEMVGVLIGAVLGAWTAGRFAWRIEKGPRIGSSSPSSAERQWGSRAGSLRGARAASRSPAAPCLRRAPGRSSRRSWPAGSSPRGSCGGRGDELAARSRGRGRARDPAPRRGGLRLPPRARRSG